MIREIDELNCKEVEGGISDELLMDELARLNWIKDRNSKVFHLMTNPHQRRNNKI